MRSDSLLAGVVFLLGLTVVQRLVGLLRNVLFCGLLEDDQLGRWSLAMSFLMLAAPLAVLGLPGSFGRYVEYYRQRGQLRMFLGRTTAVCILLAVLASGLIWAAPQVWARMVFGDPGQARLLYLLGGALLAVIVFNYLTELFTALRLVRIVSVMQLVHSLLFAAVGLGLIWGTSWGEEAVVIAFAAGALVASLGAAWYVAVVWRSLPRAGQPLAPRDLWARLLPFAGWVWATNLLANLFEAGDRFMIVHLAPVEAGMADSLVGQYHCSRVVPEVLVAVAAMLGGVMLPYLSQDWEAGRREAVAGRLHLALKLVAVGFTFGAVLVLLAAPLLFGWALRGKYDAGLAVLPWTLMYCVWFSLITVAQNYLWCAERAGRGSLALLLGVLINVALNALLLPRLGLLGAVLATTAANALTLGLIYWFSRQVGLRWERGVVLASSLPLLLALGPGPAAVALLPVAWMAWRTDWLFRPEEKQQLLDMLKHYMEKSDVVLRPAARSVS